MRHSTPNGRPIESPMLVCPLRRELPHRAVSGAGDLRGVPVDEADLDSSLLTPGLAAAGISCSRRRNDPMNEQLRIITGLGQRTVRSSRAKVREAARRSGPPLSEGGDAKLVVRRLSTSLGRPRLRRPQPARYSPDRGGNRDQQARDPGGRSRRESALLCHPSPRAVFQPFPA